MTVQTASAADVRGMDATVLPRPTPAAPDPRRLPPGVIALLGLAVGVAILVVEVRSHRLSTDVFWQMAAGQWMVGHHAVVGLDPFSYTESHRRWVADEWGSEVVLAALYKAFGAAAYSIVAIVTGTLSLACTMLYARALGARGGRLAAIAILVAMGIAGFVAQDRGLSFSLIWLPLELLILTKARTDARWLWALPALCVVWVNTHGSILLGLAVLGAELAWSVAPPRLVDRLGGVGQSPRPRALAAAAAASAAAACLSPYGPGLLAYDLRVATNSQIGKYIQEWQPPNFHSVMILLYFCVPLTVFVVAVRRRRLMVLETTLTVAFLLGTLHSVRVIIYLMIAAAGLSATLPARGEWGSRARRIAGALGVAFGVIAIALPGVPAGSVARTTPVQAFNFLASHPGRIFTDYTWSDYSIVRHRATFADGRTDLFTGPVLSDFFAVSDVTANPDPILSRYHVDYVVWAPRTPLAVYLAHDARWVMVDRTAAALVFARQSVWGSTGQ